MDTLPMGGDGGYVPKRGDIVFVQRHKKGCIDTRSLLSMYYDSLGNAYAKQRPGLVKLAMTMKDGHAYCSVAGKRISRPMFSFPCGCLFDASVSEFVADTCPVCDNQAELFPSVQKR